MILRYFSFFQVKAAGYRPLINEGGSTTSEDTLKNANTVSEAVTKASSTNSTSTKIVTTSQRKMRPKFVRQMSFDLDTDTETSLTIDGGTISVTTTSSRTRGGGGHIKKQSQSQPQDKKKISSTSNLTEQSTITNNVIEDTPPHGLHPTSNSNTTGGGGASTSTSKNIEIVEATTNTEATMTEDDDSKEASDETNSNKKRSRPALTIKIQNSSFHDQENEEDLASELEKSPRLYISGKQ